MYNVEIMADSHNGLGQRLTTFVVTYPRFVHSELMTHRMFSRNSSSSRAIPIEKMIKDVKNNPVIPVEFGKNQPGMQAKELFEGSDLEIITNKWLEARDNAVKQAKELNYVGVHKQLVNRLLEPFMWITVIVSATEWKNFFKLRCHLDAQPEIRRIAEMMQDAYAQSNPQRLNAYEWHLPFISWEERNGFEIAELLKIATGRIARVSYLTHEGKRDTQADSDLHDKLVTSGHWSPFEHCAQSQHSVEYFANFRGFKQYRKQFAGEDGNE